MSGVKINTLKHARYRTICNWYGYIGLQEHNTVGHFFSCIHLVIYLLSVSSTDTNTFVGIAVVGTAAFGISVIPPYRGYSDC